MIETNITTEYITLGQLLKFKQIVTSGAEVKSYLAENIVLINDEAENRRGRKLYPGDIVKLENLQLIIIKK